MNKCSFRGIGVIDMKKYTRLERKTLDNKGKQE